MFARAWMFVAHESEIPQTDDYVVRRMVDDSFMVSATTRWRGARHVQHVPAPGDAGVPRRDAATHALPVPVPRVDLPQRRPAWRVCRSTRRRTAATTDSMKDGQALLPAPRVGIRHGLIFASLDPTRRRSTSALGDFGFYLDFYIAQSESRHRAPRPAALARSGATGRSAPRTSPATAYHTPHTHASVVDIGLFGEPKANKRKEGALYFAGGGGGTTYKLPPGRLRARAWPTSATRPR